jgi:hypothetical protein
LKRNGAYAGDIQAQQLGLHELFETKGLSSRELLIEMRVTVVKEIWLI